MTGETGEDGEDRGRAGHISLRPDHGDMNDGRRHPIVRIGERSRKRWKPFLGRPDAVQRIMDLELGKNTEIDDDFRHFLEAEIRYEIGLGGRDEAEAAYNAYYGITPEESTETMVIGER
ncbi:hypothetical protein D2E23_1108 [Bifidobacterium callimiconis]|uniref:Uncharacterized protein n=2 Tax=Bifidobacterium callimiconis TaxID=2306973 RepID=A0A430FEI5_9BIFI|nr:hypothetical protein D2E23_1108 [Bifidobacterium callimiconis]